MEKFDWTKFCLMFDWKNCHWVCPKLCEKLIKMTHHKDSDFATDVVMHCSAGNVLLLCDSVPPCMSNG